MSVSAGITFHYLSLPFITSSSRRPYTVGMWFKACYHVLLMISSSPSSLVQWKSDLAELEIWGPSSRESQLGDANTDLRSGTLYSLGLLALLTMEALGSPEIPMLLASCL